MSGTFPTPSPEDDNLTVDQNLTVNGNATVTGTLTATQIAGSVNQGNPGSTAWPVQVSNASLPLPTGAATAANQPALAQDGGALVHVTNFPASAGGGAASGTVAVSNFPAQQAVTGTFFQATQPISAAALPLPSGAATAAAQPALNSDGGALNHVTNWPTTQAVSGTVGITGGVAITNSSLTVSATSLPLPTGAATAAGQPALNSDGGSLSHITNWPATQAVSATTLPLPTGAATAAGQPSLNVDGGSLSHVTNWPTSQAVTGSVAISNSSLPVTGTFYQATQPVSLVSQPLPTGASTSALQPALNSDGGALSHITNTSLAVTGNFYQATQPVSFAALPTGSNTIGNVTRTTASPPNTSQGTVTALASTTVSGSTSTTVVPAATGTRWRATLFNNSAYTLWARADGGVAAVGVGIPIAAGAAYEWIYPLTGAAPAPAITAIMNTSQAGTVSGEYVQ